MKSKKSLSRFSAMLEHEPVSTEVTQVSYSTTTLVKFYPVGSPTNRSISNTYDRKKLKVSKSNQISPASSNCAITSSSATIGSRGERDERPPFVTTVTRGKFLPSKFDLMVEKSLFTFSSRPRPVGLVTRHKCSLSNGPLKEHNSNSTSSKYLPRGAHDYYNMMYDPHIYRGRASTVTTSPPKSKIGESENENKTNDGNLVNGNENKYRRKRQTYTGNGGGSRSKYKITTRVTSRTKGLTRGERQHTHVQTEQFLEDLDGDLTAEERDATVQTDSIGDDITISQKRQFLPIKSGVDATTQVLPGELFSFDEEIQPFLETFVGKILQQSLLETMEEEEIGALREQQNRFLEKRKQEEKLLKELQQEQERILQEKERLRAEMKGEREEMSAQDRVILDQALRVAAVNQPNISTSYLIELLPSVLNSLRQEGYLNDTGGGEGGDDLFSTFLPMWQSSSKAESEIGEPVGESSGSISADPDEPNKLNLLNTTEDSREEINDPDEYPEEIEASPEKTPPPPELSETVASPVEDQDVNTTQNEGETINKFQNGSVKNFDSIPDIIQGGAE